MRKVWIGLLSVLLLAACSNGEERSLSQELEGARASFNALESSAEEIIERNNTLSSRVDDLSEQNSTLQTRVDTLSSENETLRTRNQALERQLGEASTALENALNNINAAEANAANGVSTDAPAGDQGGN